MSRRIGELGYPNYPYLRHPSVCAMPVRWIGLPPKSCAYAPNASSGPNATSSTVTTVTTVTVVTDATDAIVERGPK